MIWQMLRAWYQRLFSGKHRPKAEEPELIYRVISTTTPKGVSLHSVGNYQTGLSFTTEKPSARKYLTYRISVLRKHDFQIRLDGGEIARNIWSGEMYIEPNSESMIKYPENHVSVWHRDYEYWYQWHRADANITSSTDEKQREKI